MVFDVSKMNLKAIKLAGNSGINRFVYISESDGFLINRSFSQDFRILDKVYDLLKEAQKSLPLDASFCIYEAYRPLSRQIEMWNRISIQMKNEHPDISKIQLQTLCENFIANPYDGIGSGHQAGCAVDVTLCDCEGHEIDMGTKMHEFNSFTETYAEGISENQKMNRSLLVSALEKVGFANYPAEWWHFSYGDHQWAWLTNAPHAIYGPVDI